MGENARRYFFRHLPKPPESEPPESDPEHAEAISPEDNSFDEGGNEQESNSFAPNKNDSTLDESLKGRHSKIKRKTSYPQENNDLKTSKKTPKTPSVGNTKNWKEKLPTISSIVLIAFLIVISWHTIFNTKDIPQELVARPSFQQFKEDKINKLKNEFPSQDSKQFWKVVNAPIRRMFIEEDPSYPAILLFAIPKGPTASITGSCLARQLTKHLNVFHGRNEAFIDIDKDLTHANAAGDKRELDDKLINLYGVKESKGVAVDHFEKLSPLATLLFHGYCDGDHAPYKNVSMVLVLHTDINHEDILRDKSAVDNFLQNLWAKELDGDKIPPLISRIANNVAIVTPEEEFSIKKLCPRL